MNISLMVVAGAGLRSFRAPCALPLAPGLYTVHRRIFTADGHLSHGRFSFQVAGRA